jgi:acetyl-CoA synthetase
MSDGMPEKALDTLLLEHRTFDPSPEFRRSAIARDPGVYAQAATDPESFWASFARELEWIRPYDPVLEWKAPDAKWTGS